MFCFGRRVHFFRIQYKIMMRIIKRMYLIVCVSVQFLILQPNCDRKSRDITLGSLLQEMTDRVPGKNPVLEFRCRQFSSYNNSVKRSWIIIPGLPIWTITFLSVLVQVEPIFASLLIHNPSRSAFPPPDPRFASNFLISVCKICENIINVLI